MSVCVSFFTLFKCSYRCRLLTDRNPSNANLFAGKADTISALTAATGPGIDVTVTPFSAHRRTRSSPGSDMAGVPASDTRATSMPSLSIDRIYVPFSRLLCS